MTTTARLELLLPATPTSVRSARAAVEEAVQPGPGTERVVDDIRLCVSEAVTNAVRHAYGSDEGSHHGWVGLEVEQDGDDVTVVVRDRGRGFARSRRTGESDGYGLEIIATLASSHTIRTADDGTEVSMAFALTREPSRAHFAR